MVKMAEKEIPGVVMNHKREWRQWKRDLDEGRGEKLCARYQVHVRIISYYINEDPGIKYQVSTRRSTLLSISLVLVWVLVLDRRGFLLSASISLSQRSNNQAILPMKNRAIRS